MGTPRHGQYGTTPIVYPQPSARLIPSFPRLFLFRCCPQIDASESSRDGRSRPDFVSSLQTLKAQADVMLTECSEDEEWRKLVDVPNSELLGFDEDHFLVLVSVHV